MRDIVIVGASLAGLRAAQRLRTRGFTETIVLVGEEPWAPYDRPPLSKQILTGDWSRPDLDLASAREYEDLGLELRLGVRAEGVSVARREVVLSDGSVRRYDGLVVATGARARRLPGVEDSPRVHVIRTWADAERLHLALGPGVRLGVLGGGFLGSEVASAAVGRGAEVCVVERDALPMAGVLGDVVGAQLAHLQQAGGVQLRTSATVAAVEDLNDRVAVLLADGSSLEFDHVLVSIGAVPNVEWLTDAELEIDDGLVTTPTLFAADGVVAAGDVVRIRNADGSPRRRVEHWTNAAAQGEAAADSLLAGVQDATAYEAVPYVWSDQFGSRVEMLGHPTGGEVEEIWSSADRNQLLFASYADGEVEALVGVNAVRWLLGVRRSLQGAAALDQAAVADLLQAVRRAS